MANKNLFKSASVSKTLPPATTVNLAGGAAYEMTDEHALAQFASTGTFNGTFYANADEQLDKILDLARKVRPAFLAKVAIYSREKGLMKDAPAFLLAVLAVRDVVLFKKVFNRVIDNGKMLRNFMQIIRSGKVGRKSFGSAPKKAIRNWLESRTDSQLFADSVGNDPSMADIIKMVHPRPRNPERERLYAYLIGKCNPEWTYPQAVAEFEAFKKAGKGDRKVPNVPFQMLTALDLSEKEWSDIAKNARWQMTRMNLNTFARHGVLKDKNMVKLISERLRSEKDIVGAKAFPYQLMNAYMNTGAEVPVEIKNSLQDALEIATRNVPSYSGKVWILVDVSGSMSWSITGNRPGATSVVRCIDVAALIASCVVRKNDTAEVVRFHTSASVVNLNPRDSVMTNTRKILEGQSGGTDCASALRLLNQRTEKGDLVVFVSDNMSWVSNRTYNNNATPMQNEWQKFKARNRGAKLVCIDLVADNTMQAQNSSDTLNIGGFSDQVFEVISNFLESNGSPDFWTNKIENEVQI